MLTHGNFLTEIGVAVHELEALFAPGDDGEQPSTLLFLPLAHVFARIIQVGAIRSRVRLGHSADIRNLVPTLQEFRPTFVLAVPAGLREGLQHRLAARDRRRPRQDLRPRGRDRDRLVARPRRPQGPRLARRARAARGVRPARLRHAARGPRRARARTPSPAARRSASGSGHFYRGIGLVVLEGYGLTETTAAVTVNLPEAQRVGSVGRPLPGTAVRVADDGELLFRGGQVFAGYWNDDAATAEALEADGWFHTGDVGEVDDEGFVRITGRKKEILVTAGGKNVAPAVLEDRLRAHALVSQALVVGDRQPFIAALVTLDAEALPLWAEAHGKTGAEARPAVPPTWPTTPTCWPRCSAPSTTPTPRCPRPSRSASSGCSPTDWTEEDGQLTPSLKLRRNVVMRECKDEIAALYL